MTLSDVMAGSPFSDPPFGDCDCRTFLGVGKGMQTVCISQLRHRENGKGGLTKEGSRFVDMVCLFGLC